MGVGGCVIWRDPGRDGCSLGCSLAEEGFVLITFWYVFNINVLTLCLSESWFIHQVQSQKGISFSVCVLNKFFNGTKSYHILINCLVFFDIPTYIIRLRFRGPFSRTRIVFLFKKVLRCSWFHLDCCVTRSSYIYIHLHYTMKHTNNLTPWTC